MSRFSTSFLMLACALLLTLGHTHAQGTDTPAPETPPVKPADDAEAEKKDSEEGGEKKADESAEDELLEFDSYAAIVDHFEPLRAEIQQEYEKKARVARMKPEDIEALNAQLKAVDQRFVKAVKAYVEKVSSADPAPKDLLPARRELVMFASRFGEWEDTITLADTFIAEHASGDEDSTREVRWLRADALSQLQGREEDAVKALKGVLETYDTSFEAGLARMRLYQMYLFLDQVDSARRLILDMFELPEVESDPDAQDYLATLLDNLGNIGDDVPDFDFETPEGDKHARANLIGKPFILWYWDSTQGICLDELEGLREVANKWKRDLKVFPMSVNASKEAWLEFVKSDEESALLHRFEGNIEGEGDDRLSSTKMGFNVIPMTILVDADGEVHRFDVPSHELERTITHWIGEPSPEPEKKEEAGTEGE